MQQRVQPFSNKQGVHPESLRGRECLKPFRVITRQGTGISRSHSRLVQGMRVPNSRQSCLSFSGVSQRFRQEMSLAGIMPAMNLVMRLLGRAYGMFARVFPRCSVISQAIAFNLFLAFFLT